MQTYRIFDTYLAADDGTDVLIFGPRWLARLICWAKGPRWDYQDERGYQRHYARAKAEG